MMSLSQIADGVGTDKGPNYHGFTDFYEQYLGNLKQEKHLRILELGVLGGASLLMWNQFFDGRVKIFGLDIEPLGNLEIFSYPNIVFIQADQTDSNQLQRVIQETGEKFDLIVDDGGHTLDCQVASIRVLHHFLKPKGYYILEDLHTSYLPEYMEADKATTLELLLRGELEQNVDMFLLFSRAPFPKHMTSIIKFK